MSIRNNKNSRLIDELVKETIKTINLDFENVEGEIIAGKQAQADFFFDYAQETGLGDEYSEVEIIANAPEEDIKNEMQSIFDGYIDSIFYTPYVDEDNLKSGKLYIMLGEDNFIEISENEKKEIINNISDEVNWLN